MNKSAKEINYNIHNILGIRIKTRKRMDICRDMNLPYFYFEVKQTYSPEIILNIGEFTPQNNSCHVIDHKYHIKENYIYCSEHIGKIKFNIEIINIEKSPVIINVNSNFRHYKQILFPDVLSQYIALRPVLEFVLLSRGFLPVHAAAAANNEGTFIFLGRGGTYKTTLMMDYIRKMNYGFLGEDRIILNNKNVFSFPIHYKLFDYRADYMRTENYSFFDKYKYFQFQKKSVSKPGYIINKSKISSIFLINKSNTEKMSVKEMARDEVVAKTILSQKMETISGPVIMNCSKGIYDYFTAYSYVFPESKIARYWDDYNLLLTKYLNQNTYYEISLPKHYTESTFDDFTEIIKSLENNLCRLETIPSTV